MVWDYKNNTPVAGTFLPLKLETAKVKEVLQLFVYDPIVEAAFASLDYDPDKFLLRKAYRKIPSHINLDYLFLLLFKIEQKPFLTDYFADIADGYFEIFDRPKEYKWNYYDRPVEDIDIVSRLYFSDSEEDIWDLVHDLPETVKESLYNCYEGNVPCLMNQSYLEDPDKSSKMKYYLNLKQNRRRQFI